MLKGFDQFAGRLKKFALGYGLVICWGVLFAIYTIELKASLNHVKQQQASAMGHVVDVDVGTYLKEKFPILSKEREVNNSNRARQFGGSKGLLTYAKAFPLPTMARPGTGTANAFGPGERGFGDGKTRWMVAAILQQKIITAETLPLRSGYALMVIGSALVLAVGCWLLSFARAKCQRKYLQVESEHQYRLIVETMAQGLGMLDQKGKLTIANQQQAGGALRESGQLVKGVLGSLHTGVILLDTKLTIIECNAAAAEIFCFQREEMVGQSMACLHLSPEAQQVFLTELNRSVGEVGFLEDYGFEMKRSNGKCFQSYLTVRPLENASGTLVGYVTAIEDVSRRKEAEAAFSQSQKLEAIGRLTGGIAHDFNNILTAIKGFSELVKEDLETHNTDTTHIDQVLIASGRAIALVRQILIFSLQTETQSKKFKLSHVIDEVLKFMRASLPSTIEIKHSTVDSSCIIEGDPTQIHQVLVNLCTNAGHAMGKAGGTLEVVMKRFGNGVEGHPSGLDPDPQNYVKLSVSDTGHGIAPKHIEQIFKPFFTTKDVGEGTGLGLSLVHKIVNEMGGKITVESEAGTGTTFTVTLPVVTGEIETPEGTEFPQSRGTERIMVIDDEAAIVDVTSQLLRNLGYFVVGETSSAAARQTLSESANEFDLVITDLTMPEMTGIELAKELKTLRPTLPVILCTGFGRELTQQEVSDTSHQANIVAYLSKPIPQGELAAIIRYALDGNPGFEDVEIQDTGD